MTDARTETTDAQRRCSEDGDFFQRGNYAPVADELTEFDLPVDGSIPPELDGWYLRNGPNPRQATGHWFIGDGMIHGVRIEGGRADWYRNRWVRTDSFNETSRSTTPTAPAICASAVANTHVVNHAGKTLALVESSLPYEITNDLETVGAYDFGGKLVDSMTAHPEDLPDHRRDALLRLRQHLRALRHLPPRRRRRRPGRSTGRSRCQALTMMHDFTLTAEHVVFMDLPVVFNLDIAITAAATCLPLGRRLRRTPGRPAPRRPVRRDPLVRHRPVLRVPRRQRLRRRRHSDCAARHRYPELWRRQRRFEPTA